MKWRATIKEVSSAIVNDDFEKIIGDILAIEEFGYNKGSETFSARLKERTKITLEIARQEYEDEEQFTKRIYDVIGTGVEIIESVPAAIAAAYYAQDPNRCALLCANLGGDTDTIYHRRNGDCNLRCIYRSRCNQKRIYRSTKRTERCRF